MRATLTLDDDLVREASRFTGIDETTRLVHEALRALIAREAARRLIALGGSDPTAKAPPRRKTSVAKRTPRA
jgi:Arc/MetJ family transcription regulator